MLTGVFVIARILANPISNVFQKRLAQNSANPIFIIGATHAWLALTVMPWTFAPGIRELPAPFWGNMALCALLAVAGNVTLVYALKSTDLSVLGPINSYKAVISLVLGFFLIGETPTVIGLTGVLLILAGSYLIVNRQPLQPRTHALLQFFRERGVQLRFAALALSATEAVFLKKALLLSSPFTTFVWWSVLGFPLAALALAVVPGGGCGPEIERFQTHWRTFLWLALTTGVMQLTTLLTFGKLQVGYSLALFQLSTLISVFLGHHFFREGHLRRRLLSSLVMVAGALLIVLFGHQPS